MRSDIAYSRQSSSDESTGAYEKEEKGKKIKIFRIRP